MLNDRKDLYKKLLVDDNKEIDYLDTKLHTVEFDSYVLYTIPQFAENRIDMISYIHYGTVQLWWLIAQYNDMIDPSAEIVMGKVIRIPNVTEFYGFYNENARIDDINEVFDKRVFP